MQAISFPPAYDNEAAHRQVKLLMKQGKQLNIRIEDEAWISSQGVTGIRYQLNESSWQWILNYLQTGDYEDFGVFPSDIPRFSFEDEQESKVKELVEQKCNIACIPFLRETQAFVKLRGLFKFGKLFFSIRRTDDFMDYLNEKGIVQVIIAIADLLSGITVPIPFFPKFLQSISKCLPFQYVSDLPFRIYVGNINITTGLYGFLIQIVWAMIIIAIGYIMMRKSLKRVVVQGG